MEKPLPANSADGKRRGPFRYTICQAFPHASSIMVRANAVVNPRGLHSNCAFGPHGAEESRLFGDYSQLPESTNAAQ